MVAVMAALLMTVMVFFSQRGNIVATATLDAMRCHIQMVGGCGEPGDSTAAGAEGSGTTTAGNTSGGVTAAEPPQWSDLADADADAGTSPDAAASPSSNPFANFTIMDWVQLILDVVGFIPFLGEVADFINAIISLVRGDLVGAGLSLAAMWPAGGQGVTIAKIGVKYGDEVAAVIKNLDEAVAGVRKGGDEVAAGARQGDEVADGIANARRDPCFLGSVPMGKGPGLTAPLQNPCDDLYELLGVDPPRIRISENDAAYANVGAHTLQRHGSDIPLRSTDPAAKTIESRVTTGAGWGGRTENFAYKWTDDSVMQDTINRYLAENWDNVRLDLATTGKFEGTFEARNLIGEGFYNANAYTGGPRVAVPDQTSFGKIIIELDPGTQTSPYIITTFPKNRPPGAIPDVVLP